MLVQRRGRLQQHGVHQHGRVAAVRCAEGKHLERRVQAAVDAIERGAPWLGGGADGALAFAQLIGQHAAAERPALVPRDLAAAAAREARAASGSVLEARPLRHHCVLHERAAARSRVAHTRGRLHPRARAHPATTLPAANRLQLQQQCAQHAPPRQPSSHHRKSRIAQPLSFPKMAVTQLSGGEDGWDTAQLYLILPC